MAATAFSALVCVLGLPAVGLHPVDRVGEATRVVVELKAAGLFKPSNGPDEPKAKAVEEPKPYALKVETRLEFVEKVLAVGAEKTATRAVRKVERAGAAINGEVRPTSTTLRNDVRLLAAELRNGRVVVVSPGGPLTRGELELLEGPADPLALAALLPAGDVAVGDTWSVGSDAARSLGGYDALDDNALKATLESLDDAKAVVRLHGTVRGSALGSLGTITIKGTFGFDRRAGRVDALDIERAEVRKAGPVEAGLDVKSTLTVRRTGVEAPGELSDEVLKDVPLDVRPERELLTFLSPDGKYSFIHDRDWHIYWDSERQTVLKRLTKGEVVATCNLSRGPNAGKGRHQDPKQLRDDIKRAAGSRFVEFLGEGTVDGAPEGGYRYKVSVHGREGNVDVLWYYVLIAGSEGDQVLAVFTLSPARQEAFGDGDVRLVAGFEWTPKDAKP